MIPFPARFDSGMCPANCGERLHAGDMLIRDDDLGFIHASCTPKASKYDIQPGETICPDCRLIRPCRC